VLSDLLCEENHIWGIFEVFITKKRTRQILEILLKWVKPGVSVRSTVCIVSISARTVGVFTPAGSWPLHVNKNWLDSFQISQLGNSLCALGYKICLSVNCIYLCVNLLTLSKEFAKQAFQDQNFCDLRVKLKITGNNVSEFNTIIISRQLEHISENPSPDTF